MLLRVAPGGSSQAQEDAYGDISGIRALGPYWLTRPVMATSVAWMA